MEPPLRRSREYLVWLVGDAARAAGAGVGSFAFPLVVLSVTGSAAATGVIGLVQGVAGLAGIVPGGVIADRYDRRLLLVLSGASGVLAQLVLVLVLVGGSATLPVLAVIAAADRFRGGLLGPASDVILKQIVPVRQLPRASAVNQGRDAAVELGAGPLGGALLGVHLALPAIAQLLGSLVAVASALLLRGRYLPRSDGADARSAGRGLAEAVRWVLSQRVRVQLILVAALVNMASGGVLLLVTLSLAQRGVPAAQIGLVSSVLAGSVLVGALIAPALVARVPTGMLVIWQILGLALAALALVVIESIGGIIAVYALMGLGLPAINAAAMGLFTAITPIAMLGRVGALTSVVTMALAPSAPAIAGWGLEALGRGPTMAIFAGVSAVAVLVALRGRGLRSVPASAQWEEWAAKDRT